MSFADIIEKEARLVVLRTLAEQPDNRLNSSLLRNDLDERWGINRSRDWLHIQLGLLADVGAVILADAGSVKIVTLTARGLDHVEGRHLLEGVKRPSPGEN